jgi:hypothetical protein
MDISGVRTGLKKVYAYTHSYPARFGKIIRSVLGYFQASLAGLGVFYSDSRHNELRFALGVESHGAEDAFAFLYVD